MSTEKSTGGSAAAEDLGDVPGDRSYTTEHEWVTVETADTVRVGVTDFAQRALGDVVYVSLPEPGSEVLEGEPMGEVESTKSVADVFAPVSGTVVSRNGALDANPELVNLDPYGEGWVVVIRTDERTAEDAVEGLLTATGYAAMVSQSS